MGFPARAFVNEYGWAEFHEWRKSRIPLPSYEKELMRRLNLTGEPPVTTAVREYDRLHPNDY